MAGAVPTSPGPGPAAASGGLPDPEHEREAFRALQARLCAMFRDIFPDRAAPRTVVVLPSLSLDQEVMAKISGVLHYEERMLCMLLLLRLPRTRVVYLTSRPVAESTVDYYLHLLSGVPHPHARRRLDLLSCHDSSLQPLSAKILARPRLLARIRGAIEDPRAAHMTCFTVSPLERALAVRLGIPILGCDPDLLHLGTKSNGRKLFRAAGVPVPDGFEDLRDGDDVADALAALKARNPALRRAVVKLDEGFSGEANAVFRFDAAGGEAPTGVALKDWVRARLPSALAFEAEGMTWEAYRPKLEAMGGIVEAFVEGAETRSPSAQYRVDPLGRLELVSTHDQVLGGPSGQIFLGCRFPADPSYRLEIQAAGLRAAEALRDRGVLGRFGIDFISVRDGDGWRHYAIEINLRKGGTTHPFLMLQFLTDGRYDPETGTYTAASGRPCCYVASDNVQSERYRGLTPEDLIDIAVLNDLHFDAATQEGVVFHLIDALSEFGKVGAVCVAASPERARRLYDEVIAVLDREAGAFGPGAPDEGQGDRGQAP